MFLATFVIINNKFSLWSTHFVLGIQMGSVQHTLCNTIVISMQTVNHIENHEKERKGKK